ncbi:MAG TPA: nucleotidyltransferase family protein [Burkholderiales bacterium]|nr:nucleotidyltransferase family protein [Burkholderiales bacterium]
MNVILLAAGRGERMRPLTDSVPKALLAVGGRPLIVRHLEKLAAAGFERAVINHAHLGAAIEDALGDGSRYGIRIVYSREQQALETAGGIAHALPSLGSAPFAAVNADVFSDYDYAQLARAVGRLAAGEFLAHLVLVGNPQHHPAGDFALRDGRVVLAGHKLTFSGIAAYRAEMFAEVARGSKAKLAPLLVGQIGRGRVSGEHFHGRWRDIGTPERLAALDRELASAD